MPSFFASMDYTPLEISRITGARLVGSAGGILRQIVYDSRLMTSGQDSLFLALDTSVASGLDYIKEVVSRGCSTVLASRMIDEYPEITWLIHPDPLQALQDLAKNHISRLNLKTVGITGSNGKTIVKEWLSQALRSKFQVVKSPKSHNSQLGLPLSLLQAEELHEVGIFEVGISHPDEMQRSANIFSPQIGIFTHLGTAHLANFRSEEDILREKLKLFHSSTLVFLPSENLLVEDVFKQIYPKKEYRTFGKRDSDEVQLLTLPEDTQLPVSIRVRQKILTFYVKNRQTVPIHNALAVISVLDEMGFSGEEIVSHLDEFQAVEMRMETVMGERNNLIINDSYTLDWDSLRMVLEGSRQYLRSSRVLVLSDMKESGQRGKGLYVRMADLIQGYDFDLIILIGEEISHFASLFGQNVKSFYTTRQALEQMDWESISESLVVLKGARHFAFERILKRLEFQRHDTVLEVNLPAILHNIQVHRSLLPLGTKVMAMVKANAYGLGGGAISEYLQHHRIDYLGVAYVDEGIELRRQGIRLPIMVMNPERSSYASLIAHGLEPEIYSLRVLDAFLSELKDSDYVGEYPIHLKVETGMHRLGFSSEDLDSLLEKIFVSPVKVKSVFSHLSSADDPQEKEYTLMQMNSFKEMTRTIIKALGYQPLRHILNSSGVANYPQYAFDMVRLGIGMLGESSNLSLDKKLLPVVKFRTVISQITEVKAGDSVGYNRKFKAKKDTRIATLPVGYADGIPRLVGCGVGKLQVQGQSVPIAGNVCMDMLMIDLGKIQATEGEEVIIFHKKPSLSEFATWCQTIPYEVLTSISKRVKRIYIKD